MRIEAITTGTIEFTPALEAYLMKRVRKLAKIVQRYPSATIRIVLEEEVSRYRKRTGGFSAEFVVVIEDDSFRAHKTDVTIYRAIEKARVDMHQKIVKWKKRKQTSQRKKEMQEKQMLKFTYDGE
jgi:ribosomal subunit interface protein